MEKKIREITDDYSVIENERPSEDVYGAIVHRALRPPPRPRMVPTTEERKAAIRKAAKVQSEVEKRIRTRRLMEGLCTRCGKVPPGEGNRMCEGCRFRGRRFIQESKFRKTLVREDNEE